MSRIANNPIQLPAGVQVVLNNGEVSIKGPKGTLHWSMHQTVQVMVEGNVVKIKATDDEIATNALAGTTRALLSNMVTGVTHGFEKKLLLKGVGYRAQVQGSVLNLSVGFSHPVVFHLPAGITAEVPEPTIIIIKGMDKQKVGQIAANIRAVRPPEPYKGKGIRYDNEHVVLKEGKKK